MSSGPRLVDEKDEEISRLKALVAELEEHIAELRSMLNRAYTDGAR